MYQSKPRTSEETALTSAPTTSMEVVRSKAPPSTLSPGEWPVLDLIVPSPLPLGARALAPPNGLFRTSASMLRQPQMLYPNTETAGFTGVRVCGGLPAMTTRHLGHLLWTGGTSPFAVW